MSKVKIKREREREKETTTRAAERERERNILCKNVIYEPQKERNPLERHNFISVKNIYQQFESFKQQQNEKYDIKVDK